MVRIHWENFSRAVHYKIGNFHSCVWFRLTFLLFSFCSIRMKRFKIIKPKILFSDFNRKKLLFQKSISNRSIEIYSYMFDIELTVWNRTAQYPPHTNEPLWNVLLDRWSLWMCVCAFVCVNVPHSVSLSRSRMYYRLCNEHVSMYVFEF